MYDTFGDGKIIEIETSPDRINDVVQSAIVDQYMLYNINVVVIGSKKAEIYPGTDKTNQELVLRSMKNVSGSIDRSGPNGETAYIKTNVTLIDPLAVEDKQGIMAQTEVEAAHMIMGGNTYQKYVLVVVYDYKQPDRPSGCTDKEYSQIKKRMLDEALAESGISGLGRFSPGGTYPFDFSAQKKWSFSVNHIVDGNIHSAEWSKAKGQYFINALSHETLHILGISDAYGNDKAGNLLIPFEVAPGNDIMRSPYKNPQLSNLEVFMLREAVQTGIWQQFTQSFDRWQAYIDQEIELGQKRGLVCIGLEQGI